MKDVSPEQLAEKIIKKLGKEPSIPIVEKEQKNEGKIYLAANILFGEYYGFMGGALGVTITNIEKEHRYFNEPYFQLSQPFEGGADTFYLVEKLRPVAFPVKLEYGEVASADYKLMANTLEMMWNKLPEDATVQAIVTTTVGERYKSNLVSVKSVKEILKPRK